MYPFPTVQLADQHRQQLQHEAEMERAAHAFTVPVANKSNLNQFWYLLLGTSFITDDAHMTDAAYADWLRRRTQALMRVIALLALGIGALLGGILDNQIGLLPTLVLGGIIALVVSLPVIARLLLVVQHHLMPLAHHR